MKVLITRRRSTKCSSMGCGTASTQKMLFSGRSPTLPTLSAGYCESRGKYHSIYTKETYCTPSMCTLRACFVWSTHVTYTVTGRRKKNCVQSRKSAKREKEFSTYCKLYKFTYICIFDNGKLYKLMNIQHSCKYSLISIPIYV